MNASNRVVEHPDGGGEHGGGFAGGAVVAAGHGGGFAGATAIATGHGGGFAGGTAVAAGHGGGDGSSGHDHGGDGHGGGGHTDGGLHLTLRGYVTGFFAAVFLTAIPFWLVMGKTLGGSNLTAAVILAFAAVQIVVHMVYFLHMSPKSEGGWNLLALLFTVMLVVIALSGSLWVMYHLNHNMMPDSMMNMRNMP
jgi:cytochrome o ubiquinol oxidase operon protein cyoD